MPRGEPGERHDDNFHEEEDKAAANIDRDDAPVKDPKKEQEFLRQRQGDWDSEDVAERAQLEADGLFEDAKEAGLLNGSKGEYEMVYKYIRYGQANTEKEKEFFKKLEAIEDELKRRKGQGKG